AFEVYAIGAEKPRSAGVEIHRLLEEHPALRRLQGLGHELEAQKARALGARDRSHPRERRGARVGRSGGAGLPAHPALGHIKHAGRGAEGRSVTRSGRERVLDEAQRIRHRETSGRLSERGGIIRKLTARSRRPEGDPVTGAALALVLSAAVIHATWNALAKGAREPMAMLWWAGILSSLGLAPPSLYVLWRDGLSPRAVPFVLATVTLHSVYFFSLGKA